MQTQQEQQQEHNFEASRFPDREISPSYNRSNRTNHSLTSSNALLFRYSHTAHIINDSMVIIGGVNQMYTGSPSVVLVDLVSLTWKSFSLPLRVKLVCLAS
ncbi:hypothetical protein AC249_AIPGENE27303 [Exaiptasia diaphana]|nr:hypothetical protein AC249_AIPGENE27303 [Exaiptasia diaphana]